MASFIHESMSIEGEGCKMEFYVNSDGNVYAHDKDDEMEGRFWFTISPEDWESLKNFIDRELKEKAASG